MANTHEIVQLQDELYAEVNNDAPHIARGIFGDTSQMPDIAQVSNQQLDQVYRQKYQSDDRQWLQAEARRDPEQFLNVSRRIGAQIPPPQPPAPAAPPMLPPAPAGLTPSLPMPLGGVSPTAAPGAMPAVAPPLSNAPVQGPGMPPPGMLGLAPPPVILGPNGQPLPPSGAM